MIWLAGVGYVNDIQGRVKCTTVLINSGIFLNSWSTAYNNISGIYISNLTFSDGRFYKYGIIPTTTPTGSTNIKQVFNFTSAESISGIWGYIGTKKIVALSMITYNTTRCPQISNSTTYNGTDATNST